uniref:Polyadenylate-binding protein RBP45A n=1 Tax=Noccaea caerulescens TaxID=107243 RepID=A0A1J3DQL0_NOCCA
MMQQPPSNSAGAGQIPSDQQAYHQQQQSWMMQQQQQLQQGQPPAGWNQQSVPSPGQQQQQYYGAGSQNPGADGEIRSLWIGDLQPWMDEGYIMSIFAQSGEAQSAKVIRNKQTGQCEGYGFIEFANHAAAERVLQTYNGAQMPSCEQTFRLNWAQSGAGERRQAEGPDYTIFVGDLAPEVSDYMLTETFTNVYRSVKGAKVVTDRTTGRSKGYGFVRFSDESEQMRAMTEMNGQYCATRPMRIGPAANKQPLTMRPATYQDNQGGNPGESDPSNTTIFVGALDASVTDDELKSVFGQFGELVHVKIPPGKRCGFVQYTNRASAEQALSLLNGSQLGGQSIRLSWGRSPNKQSQPDQAQWNGGGYYGYPPQPQGYEPYGYAQAPRPQDPNAAYYGGYPGYGNYPQQRQ